MHSQLCSREAALMDGVWIIWRGRQVRQQERESSMQNICSSALHTITHVWCINIYIFIPALLSSAPLCCLCIVYVCDEALSLSLSLTFPWNNSITKLAVWLSVAALALVRQVIHVKTSLSSNCIHATNVRLVSMTWGQREGERIRKGDANN